MDNNQSIHLIVNAIQSELSDDTLKQQKLALVNKLLETANKYVAIVVQQGFLLQVHEGTSDRATL